MVIINALFGILVGFLAERSDFCTHGIISEPMVLKRWTKIRGLVALWIGFAVVFYPLASFMAPHLIPPVRVPVRLSQFIGGLILGYGMVYAGGCPFGTLYRVGKGYAQSVYALIGFVFGLIIFALLYQPVLKPFVTGELFVMPGATSLVELIAR
jgi:uncharacterized membrane protein YedE/YeeE